MWILLCVCLSACGGQTIQGKSDSEIAQDIQLNDARFSDYGYDLSTVEHRRRNTLEEWRDEERREKSNGPIEAKLICTQSKNEEYVYYISYDIPAFPTIWMYLGTGTLDHRQAGPSIDGCVLTKVS